MNFDVKFVVDTIQSVAIIILAIAVTKLIRRNK